MLKLSLCLIIIVLVGVVYSFITVNRNQPRSCRTLQLSLQVSVKQKAADALLGGLFSIKPLFRLAAGKARNRMINQAKEIGVDWKSNVENYRRDMDSLNKIYDTINSKTLNYPEYYLKPFHAYDEGNLSWLAAMEVESASHAVHAHIFSEDLSSPTFVHDGDYRLRDNFHKRMKENFETSGFRPSRIVDVGCSGGLSSLKLHESFPDAEIIGVDLSPYMLSVAQYDLKKHPEASKYITYVHGSGELVSDIRDPVDMISMCLVCHELPSEAARNVFKSAYDTLEDGGALSIMDMDPTSARIKRLASNPFAFAGFKSTEPWIQEYFSLDIKEALRSVGFKGITITSNSPQHRTIVAYK